jgi:AraC-like DNA-binding protein
MQSLKATENPLTFLEASGDFTRERPFRIWRKQYGSRGERVRAHYHPMLEILYCSEVEGTIRVAGKEYPIADKNLISIAPKLVHSLEIASSPGYILILQLSMEGIAPLLDMEKVLALDGIGFGDIPPITKNCEEIIPLFKMLESEQDLSAIRGAAVFSQMLEVLSRPVRNRTISSGNRTLTGHPVLHRVIDWTEEHYQAPVGIEQVASVAEYSPTAFCRLFKRLTGSTYFSYLRQVRLEHARLLLKEGKSVTETAYACGFEDLSWFIRQFRLYWGTTPKQFQLSSYFAQLRETSV